MEISLGGEQALDERVGGGEQHAVAALDQLVADGADEVGLATARQAERQEVVAALEDWGFDTEAADGWSHLTWADRRRARKRAPLADAWAATKATDATLRMVDSA